MPIYQMEEIQGFIDNDEIKGVTLDTTIFDQFGCNLKFKALTALDRLKTTKVKYLLSEITVHEVIKHITNSADQAAQKGRESLNQFINAWRRQDEIDELYASIGLDKDPEIHAIEMVDEYLQGVGASILPVEPGVSLKELVRLYFDAEPPFSNSAPKKNEFPDAIALLSLEAWAEANGGYVLAISRDGDWSRYAEESARIICLSNCPGEIGGQEYYSPWNAAVPS